MSVGNDAEPFKVEGALEDECCCVELENDSSIPEVSDALPPNTSSKEMP